jgi:hypothetical protein
MLGSEVGRQKQRHGSHFQARALAIRVDDSARLSSLRSTRDGWKQCRAPIRKQPFSGPGFESRGDHQRFLYGAVPKREGYSLQIAVIAKAH